VYLKGAFWAHYYLAYTRTIFPQCHRNAALRVTFIDDTKLITSFQLKDNLDAITDLRDDLFKIGEWCSNNLLLLNPGKTKLMIFGSRQMCAKLQFHSLPFMGKDIIPSDTAKDLGVILI